MPNRIALRSFSLILLLANAGRLAAQEADVHEYTPCGKARSMAAHFTENETSTAASSMTRETMAETDVLHYALDIEVSNLNPGANTCTVTGTNAMTIVSLSGGLSEFTFRLHSNYTITTLTVTDGGDTVPVSSSQISSSTRIATLNRPYDYGEEFVLTVAYTGTSISIDNSFDVGTQGGTPVVSTLSEPFAEYTWWPCKDGDVSLAGDNSDKATLEFNITAPNNSVIPSNGRLLGVDTLSGNRKRYRWTTDYPITTYLVSFSATNYNTWTQTYNFPAGPYNPAGSMPVQFYIYPGSDNSTNRTNWEKCLNMIATYRGIYGEYPFVNDKYGIYQFNYGGGMEHQTITGQGGFSESLTAHELSHQWWGDMITCKYWNDIWLNEGFATYSECLWPERKNGGVDTAAYLAAVNARRPTGNGAGGSVYRYVVNRLDTIFNGTYSYNKGAWVLHMLRHVIGDAAFFETLAEYRAAYAYGATTTEDFAAVAEAVSGKDLTQFFNDWVYHRGAPIYQYGWQPANIAGQDYLLMQINQTQTATTGAPPQVQSVYEMPVDLSATIGGVPQTLKVQNTARTQWFVVPTSGAVTAVTFDPGPYILRGTTTNVAYQPGPPEIVATNPAPGASIDQLLSPTQISVTFHTPVTCTQTDFTLEGTNTGGQSVTLASGAGVNPVVLDLKGPLPPDTYSLNIGTGVIATNSALALDGEIANPLSPDSLPSGDGLAGGAASIQFAVTQCQIAADIDGNCVKDFADVDLFVDVLLGNNGNLWHIQRSDMNGSGAVDATDIGPFLGATIP